MTRSTFQSVALWCCLVASCAAQSTGDELIEMIAAAESKAARDNMTAAVIVEEGAIVRLAPGQVIEPSGHVFLTTASGAPRSWRIVASDPADGEPIVRLTGDSYGAGIRGVEIRVGNGQAQGVTGILVEGRCKNAIVENCRVDLWRLADCIGLQVNGQESITVRNCELRASVPLCVAGGDNHHFENMDLGAANNPGLAEQMNRDLPRTCVWIHGIPNQWSFTGYQTYQGGDHAFYGEVNSPRTGQVLRIEGLRYEQSLSTKGTTPAIDLRFTNRAIERLVMVGCRWTTRDVGADITGTMGLETVGCHLSGSVTWRQRD